MATKKTKIKEEAKIEKRTIKIAKVIAWIVGVLVSLSVGAGMAEGTLNLTSLFIPLVVTQLAGWIVVIGIILSLVLALFSN